VDISLLYRLYQDHPSVRTDTRALQPGDLFFALKGPNFNGNLFAEQALRDGASYAIVDDPALGKIERCFLVDDVLQALQELALYHRRQLNIPVLAITGSNGKTTTKELVTAVLRQRWSVLATEGNLNNHIGVPLTLLKLRSDHDLAVVEMGANHQREIASYCTIAVPTHGLITNVGKAHIEGFGGEEGVRKGKGELYDFLRNKNGVIFRNTDLDYLFSMASGIGQQVTYGMAEHATVRGQLLHSADTLECKVYYEGSSTAIKTQLVGVYNLPNVLAAVAVGTQFSVSLDQAREAIVRYSPDNSRSQWVRRGSVSVVLDAYNANPTSMRAALDNFAALSAPCKRLWLGGMKEMGSAEQEEHSALLDYLNQWSWDQVILVGPEFKSFQGNHHWFSTSADAAGWLASQPPISNCTVLLKGSRGSKMEALLQCIPEV
jgi:UDP-N-acetylmuramoyl-tripeptide--D-alanyl-D-alanine ligase